MKSYLVIGLYCGNCQRFAQVYYAASAADAENHALKEHPGLVIAGVVTGRNMEVVL